MECKVVHSVRLHDVNDHPVDQYVVIGQVVGVHLDESAIDADGIVRTETLQPIARLGGRGDYTVVNSVFQMFRPSR